MIYDLSNIDYPNVDYLICGLYEVFPARHVKTKRGTFYVTDQNIKRLYPDTNLTNALKRAYWKIKNEGYKDFKTKMKVILEKYEPPAPKKENVIKQAISTVAEETHETVNIVQKYTKYVVLAFAISILLKNFSLKKFSLK